MSKLTELIEELCPDGVEYRPLGELLAIRDSERRPVTKSDRVSGPYPYYGANGIQDYVNEYIFDGEFILLGEDGSVLTDDFRPVTTWAAGKIWVNNHAHVIAAKSDEINLRFSYYALTSTDIRQFVSGGSRAKLNQSGLRLIPIAIPPLEVQQEIVRVLDAFTDLEQSLVSELALRKKQFEEYRNTVIDDLNSKGFEYKQLSEVIDLKPGVRITKRNDSGSLYPVYGGGGESFRTDDFNRKDDFVISRFAMSENCVRYIPGDFWLLDSGISFDVGDRVEKRFVGHNLLRMQPEIFRCSSKSAQRNLKIRALLALEIPVPPLDEQQQIVTKLDAFESLINSIEKEIVLRRRQYEYYRDELLSFNPSTSRGA